MGKFVEPIVTLLIDGEEVEYTLEDSTLADDYWNRQAEVGESRGLLLCRWVDGQWTYNPIAADDPRIVPNAGFWKKMWRRIRPW